MHSIWCEASEHILKLLMIWKVLYSYSTWQAVCLLIFCQTKLCIDDFKSEDGYELD